MLPDRPYVIFDLETWLIELHSPLPKPVCLAYSTSEGKRGVAHFRDPKFWTLLRDWMSDKNRLLIGQNVMSFDFPVLANWAENAKDVKLICDVLDEGRLSDTRVRGWLGDTADGRYKGFSRIKGRLVRHGYSLAEMYHRATGEDSLSEAKADPNGWRLRFSELDDVPVRDWPREAIDYVMGDVTHPLTIWAWQHDRWGGDILFNEPMQVAGYFGLAIAAANGFNVDTDATARYEEKLVRRREELEGMLLGDGLLEKAPRSGKITAKTKPAHALYLALCEEYGVTPSMTQPSSRFPSGQPSLTEETLAELGVETPDFDERMGMLEGWYEYKKSRMLLTRDIEMLKQGRIGTSYGWAQTGRLTSFKSNMTNAARKGPLRECIIPREGNALVSIDFSSAELVAWSEICWDMFGFSNMGEVLNEGGDPHIILGADIAGHPIDKASDYRQFAKVGNFGHLGMMGAEALCRSAKHQKIALDYDKAKAVIFAMRHRWKELPLYHRWASMVFDGAKLVQSYRTGRYRKVERITQAANTPFQGLVADMAKASNYALVKAWLTGESEYIPCVVVHDESIGEAPLSDLHDVAYQARDIMVGAAQEFLDHVQIKAEPAAMMRWHKKADTVFDNNGRLTIWSPT